MSAWTGELLPPGHPDRDALTDPELLTWRLDAEYAALEAS